MAGKVYSFAFIFYFIDIFPYLCKKQAMATESNDNTEKVIHFMNQLEQLGLQLKVAGDEQRLTLGRLLALKKEKKTDTEEYARLTERSKTLQALIDKWRPVYLERMAWVKEVQGKK